jgi:predicted dehydrogenase
MTDRIVGTRVERLGVGIVGLGVIGVQHVRAAQMSPSGRLVAVCDVDAQARARVAEVAQVEACAHVEELLARDDVDVVVVCLPHDLHHPIAGRSLEAGKHVLVEKPLALTVDECDELIRTAETNGVSLGVSHNELFYPPHERAKVLLESGELGEPLLVRLRLAADGPYPEWRSNPERVGGGVLFDAGVHRVYVARSLFGEITGLYALTDRARDVGECFALVGLEFASGARGIIEANFLAPAGYFDDSIEVVCRAGALFIPGIESQYLGFRAGSGLRRFRDGQWQDEPVADGGWEESIDHSVEAFLRSILDGVDPPTSGADGREVVALLETVYETAVPWSGLIP